MSNDIFRRTSDRTISVPATVVICEPDNTEEKCVCYRKMCYRKDLTRWTGAYTEKAQLAIKKKTTCTAGLNGCPRVWVNEKMANAR